jgi:hypothetical protein
MNEVSLTITYDELTYFSDSKLCTEAETKVYVQELKDIMDNKDVSYLTFKSGEDTHFFSRGVIDNSIVTITIRKANHLNAPNQH